MSFFSAITNTSLFFASPIAKIGMAGFILDNEKEYSINATSVVSNHTLESGSTISNHIISKPKTFRVSGDIAEIVVNNRVIRKFITDKTSQATAILRSIGLFSSQASGIINNWYGANSASLITKAFFGSTNDLWTLFNSTFPVDFIQDPSLFKRQESIFKFFDTVRQAKILIGIKTPFGYYPNLIITKINVSQKTQTTNSVSSVELSLQEVFFNKVNTSKDLSYTTDLQSTEQSAGKSGETTDFIPV